MAELRPEPLAKHVHHVVTEQEVDEGWQRLDASLRPERRWQRWWVAAAAAAGLALVVGGVALRWRSTGDEATVLQPGTAIATGETSLSGVLNEGSRLDVTPASAGLIEVASASEVRVRLDRGAVRFDVTKNPRRRFIVLAGRVEVRVVGTRFTVSREQAASVRVEQGVVEVWAEGSQRAVLTAGQSWDEAVALAEPVEPAVGLPPPVESAEAEPRPAATKSRPIRRPAPTKPTATPAGVEEPLPAPVPSTLPALPEDPSSLFRAALESRRAGRAKDAAQALHAFIGRFPDDARAGLALFELGRLEMDQLRLPSTAIETLERAIAKGPQSPYVEDAMARLVRLHHDLRHGPQCRAAKTAALERFPRGVYAATLDGLCSF